MQQGEGPLLVGRGPEQPPGAVLEDACCPVAAVSTAPSASEGDSV